ncbi:MAG: MFS transporter, partial [Aureliella sp.]
MSRIAASTSALDSARRKVYLRALPLLFVCYIIAYVDRNNVSVAQLTMSKSLPDFTAAVIGFGSGIFFLGYFLLEIPGTLIVERWSASKWICRIMVSWGLVAALTAFVKEPWHFYTIRFMLGLAEAGFFPGVIVYLTHWFPARDRARALSIFLIASPIAMIIGNYVSGMMLDIGENGAPTLFGLKGWQCVFIFWGIPAVVMGIVVVLALTDRPRQAKWLTAEERDALESELERERVKHTSVQHMSVVQGLLNPNILMLAL